MKLWKWQRGRQQGVYYKKFPLWSFRIWKWGFDAYILKYEPHTSLPAHTDAVEKGKHYRLNIPLKGNSIFYWLGADSIFGPNTKWIITKGWVLFRPDIQKHFLEVGEKGCTKLSFGFVKFNTWQSRKKYENTLGN